MKALDEIWYQVFTFLGSTSTALGVLGFLFYTIQYMGLNSRTEKYRFASKKEANVLSRTTNLIAIGLSFFAFNMISGAMGLVASYTYFFVAFFSGLIGLAIGYGMWAYLKFYYPFILEKRLNKIRFSPMKSPHSGNLMRQLNEEEEDEFMTQEMRDDEEAMTFDYDVWIDEATGHKVIERYDMSFHSLICENCNFRTLKENGEEVIKEATSESEGELRKYFQCSYCGHHQIKDIPFSEEKNIELIEKGVL
ncbi:MAG: hypothetical protein ACJA08_001656 [Cyclobacteriaceae bacterium]|jgi:hypothetical protein